MSKALLIFMLVLWCLAMTFVGHAQVKLDGTSIEFPDSTKQTTASAPPWSQRITSADRFMELYYYIGIVRVYWAVLDRETGLVWQRALDPNAIRLSWNDAHDFCTSLEQGTRKGWRLPAIEELASLVDSSNSFPLPTNHPFLNVKNNYYWSASTVVSDPSKAWTVGFTLDSGGHINQAYKTTESYVWCMRGGYGHDAY